MSLNSLMHSRNIYRNKPNFAEMAKTYKSFGAYVRTDLRGKVVFDYNDSNALRELTKTLLKKDFDLEVDIPSDRLIPTVPQRLNYILFVEDLISRLMQLLRIDGKEVERVVGLDVGTGSCAIFPLIGCTLNKNWSFVATDVDPFNVDCALNNVRKNDLNHRIKVIETTEENNFESILNGMDGKIHFLMTNPPFFGDNLSEESAEKSDQKQSGKHWAKAKSGSNTSDPIESVVDGGEVGFVSKIIDKSLELSDKIMIYSSMFGKKSSLKQIKAIIKSYAQKGVIESFVCTEFCQGFTKRWGIAWTLVRGLDLKQVPTIKSVKHKPSFEYYLPPIVGSIGYSIESVSEKITDLLKNELKIDNFEVKQNKKRIEFRIKSKTNVWSNQRKRRRELERKFRNDSNEKMDVSLTSDSNQTNCQRTTDLEEFRTEINDKKRGLDPIECEDNSIEAKKNKTSRELSANELYLLDTCLEIKRDKQSVVMRMQSQETAQNKESTYQLFQYFKNNLK